MIARLAGLFLLMAAPAMAEDPDFGKDPSGVPYVSQLRGVPFTQHELNVKEAHDACLNHPWVPSTDARTGQTTWANGEWWPSPCADIERAWTEKRDGESISEKYDRLLKLMTSPLDKTRAAAGESK